ncbi:MAG: hypothetical protein AB1696_16745 [Planctomycetota bacterium]
MRRDPLPLPDEFTAVDLQLIQGGTALPEAQEELPGAIVGMMPEGVPMPTTLAELKALGALEVRMIIPEEALAISPKVRLLYDAEVDEDLTVHDATLHVWRVTGEAACELDYGAALTPQDLQNSRFFVLGKDPGAFNLWLRPDGHSYRAFIASDFATVNVVELSMEINEPGSEDDFILAGTEGTVTVSLDGWIRPEGCEAPLEYRQYTLTNEEGGADLLFKQGDDFVLTAPIVLNSGVTVVAMGQPGPGQANITARSANPIRNLDGTAFVPNITVEFRKLGPTGWVYITEPNNHPSGTVGIKYYPDATQPGGAWNDQVQIYVTVSGFGPSTPTMMRNVYLAVFDPDDPSANTVGNVVDSDRLGGDNRGGRGTLGSDSGILTLDASGTTGTFTTTFTVSHQPGDNHRIAVAVGRRGPLAVLKDDDVPASNQQVRGFNGCISPLLTVWRNLYIELDSMTQEPDYPGERYPDIASFFAHSLVSNSPVPGLSTIYVWGGTLNPPVQGFYEGGTVSIHYGTTPAETLELEVLSNTAHWARWWYRNKIVVDGVPEANVVNQLRYDMLWTIKDDDPADPQLPSYLPISPWVQKEYSTAYISIQPLDDALNLNKDKVVPFQSNASGRWDNTLKAWTLGISWAAAQDIPSEAGFWTSLLVAGYQGPPSTDLDPDIFDDRSYGTGVPATIDEAELYGWTYEATNNNATLIFVETLREAPPFIKLSRMDVIIAHEVGHAGGWTYLKIGEESREHAEGGIMAEGAPEYYLNKLTTFMPSTLKRFRDAEVW